MKDFFETLWLSALGLGGWVTTVMLLGVALKLNAYIFMWGWNLV